MKKRPDEPTVKLLYLSAQCKEQLAAIGRWLNIRSAGRVVELAIAEAHARLEAERPPWPAAAQAARAVEERATKGVLLGADARRQLAALEGADPDGQGDSASAVVRMAVAALYARHARRHAAGGGR